MHDLKNDVENKVPEFLLRRSDLSWEERQIIEYMRRAPQKTTELLSELETKK